MNSSTIHLTIHADDLHKPAKRILQQCPVRHFVHWVKVSSPCWLLLLVSGCSSERHLSFFSPQGPVAAAERTHFLVVLGILVVFVALPIFVFLPWVLWRYRYRASKSAYVPGWKANLPLEIMTWAGPIVIVIVLSFMVWHYAHKLDPYRPLGASGQSLQVQAIGYDWKWMFIYPKQGIASVGMLAIPAKKPVAMKLTSATVMQSLHIPALVSQIYAMGGMVTQLHFQASKAGRSLGENNMYNGDGFHKQRFTVVAMAPEQFKAWVHKVKTTGASMNARIYHAISQQSTVSDLTAALPQVSHGGSIYLSNVSPDLFSAVIEHVKSNRPAALEYVLTGAPKPKLLPSATTSPGALLKEKSP